MKENMFVWCKGLGGDEKVSEAIYEHCSTISETDECEAAFKIAYCLKDTGMKHKISVDF